MHSTENSEVIGNIDKKGKSFLGWCMLKSLECKPLRIVLNNTIIYPRIVNRKDVAEFYKTDKELLCGWEFEATMPCKLQMQTNTWVTVFTFEESAPKNIKINKSIASYIVVDNFYEDVDAVREFALGCDFKHHPLNHKGKRTEVCYKFDGLKERFEKIIGSKIINWETYKTNGCFQYCIAGDQLVYHTDTQQYAGVLFLTPDAPVQSGTCLFRSKYTKKMKVAKDEYARVFKNGVLDSTEFDLVDRIGNVYNRLVLFDSKTIHAATEYFGNNKENGRLFQLFFFDLE